MTKIPIERLESDSWAPPWTRREHSERYRFASKFVGDKIVADCACGDGTSSAIFGKTAQRVYGFDRSCDAIDRANGRNHLPSVVLECGSATALPLEDRSVDVFVSLETIEHIDEDETFLEQVVRILRDDGVFVCSTPDRDVHSPGNTPSDQPWTPFHVREYSEDEFVRMLKDRFKDVSVFGQNPALVWATRMKCWIGRRFSRGFVLRVNQMVKLTWLVSPGSSRHDVVPTVDGRKYEYLVAVCSNVIRNGG